jgi:phosphatidylserine/phosphatidylglycerophosphate/cardiolipin synthase-like enzyme
LLLGTLPDGRRAGGANLGLELVGGAEAADAHKLAEWRSRAFAAARDALMTPEAVGVLEWLEEVIKVLAPQGPALPEHADACFGPGHDCPNTICHWLGHARRKIDVCVFTITDDRLSTAVLDAHRRGVAVRVLTDDEKEGDTGSDIPSFRNAGIPVRTDHSRFHMHHKFALFDDEVLINGSYNWTRGAAEDNLENVLVTSDPRLVKRYAQAFEKLWQKLGPGPSRP